MSHLPDRTKREHGKAQDGRISSNMANTAFLKDDILLHTAGFLDWHSLHSLSSASRGLRFLAEHANYTFFKGFFREVITVPGMSYFLRIAKDNAKLQAALLKAARRLETMHISIDYSSEREGKRSLTIVKKFLTTCFAFVHQNYSANDTDLSQRRCQLHSSLCQRVSDHCHYHLIPQLASKSSF